MNLNSSINKIVARLNTSSTRKDYVEDVLELGKAIRERLEEIHYDATKVPSHNLDIRLYNEDSTGVLEKMQQMKEQMYSFLKDFNLGSVSDFYAVNGTTVFVKMFLSCSCSSLIVKPSDEELYFSQVNTLKNIGMEFFDEETKRKKFLDTDKNKELIVAILNKLEGNRYEFVSRKHKNGMFLQAVSFYCSIEKLLNYIQSSEKIEKTKSDTLTEDEIMEIYDDLKGINHLTISEKDSLSTETIMMLSGNIAINAYASLCEKLNISTPETDRIIENWKENRAKNNNDRNRSKEKAAALSMSDFARKVNEIRLSLEETSLQKLNCNLSELQIQEYSVYAKFSPIIGDWFEDMPEDDYFIRTFDITPGGNRDSYSFMMLPTEKNFQKITKTLTETYKDAEIVDVKLRNQKREDTHTMCIFISEITIRINTI